MPWAALEPRLRRSRRQHRRRACSSLGSERDDGWSLEVDGASLELRFFAGPDPADALERLTLAHRPPARPRRAVVLRPLVSAARRRPRAAAGNTTLRDADVPASAVNTYLHYLPCGDQEGVEGEQPGRTDAMPQARLRDHHLLQPDGLLDLSARLQPGCTAGAADHGPGRRAVPLPLLGKHRRPLPRRSVRLLQPGHRRLLRRPPR